MVTNVTVNTGTNKHCGGLVGHAIHSTLNITNCIYSGTISNGSHYAGGLQGWSDGNTLNITNSLFSGSYTGSGLFHPIAVRYNKGTGMSGTISGAYYTVAPTLTDASFIAADGTLAYTSRQSFTCHSTTILGTPVYYAADLTPFGKTDTYTPDGTASKPYIISTTEGWNYLCDALQDNDTWNRFSGKTVRLGANIEVNRMAGSPYHDFCGIFDGQQYTLTFNYGTADSYANDEYAAPFHFVSTVTPKGGSEIPVEIKNLHVAGHIYTSAKYAAGLIAQHWGTVNVENCRVSTVIHSSVSGDGTHGGFEAECKGVLNITGCVFDGKLLATGTTATDNCGGFVGWHNGGTTNISNSLYAPAAIADGETEVGPGVNGQHPSATFGRDAVGNITNSYYTRALDEAQGTAAYAVTAAPMGEPTADKYTVSGIMSFGILSRDFWSPAERLKVSCRETSGDQWFFFGHSGMQTVFPTV